MSSAIPQELSAQTMPMTAAQRRRVEALNEQIDKICQADRLFFERHPERRHRVRLASRSEVEQLAVLGATVCPPGFRVYVAVRNVVSGVRFRTFRCAPVGMETDISEEGAAAIFEATVSPKTRALEATIRRGLP